MLTDEINILGKSHIEEQFTSNFEKDEEKENSELPTRMLMIIANTSGNNISNFEESYIEQLCNLCIDNKYTKIVRYRMITPTTRTL